MTFIRNPHRELVILDAPQNSSIRDPRLRPLDLTFRRKGPRACPENSWSSRGLRDALIASIPK